MHDSLASATGLCCNKRTDAVEIANVCSICECVQTKRENKLKIANCPTLITWEKFMQNTVLLPLLRRRGNESSKQEA